MTLYAIDQTTRALTVVRCAARRQTAAVLCTLPEAVSDEAGLRLADALTCLLVATQEAVSRSESSVDRSLRAREGLDRADRLLQLVPAVCRAVREPDPEDPDLQPLYGPAERAAHIVGRLLAEVGDPALLERIVQHLRLELTDVTTGLRTPDAA